MARALADAVALVLVVVGIPVVLLLAFGVRRRLLHQRYGTFDCSVRVPRGPAGDLGPWRLGIAAYTGNSIVWHRAVSSSARPHLTFARNDVSVVCSRLPRRAETSTLLADFVVLECRWRGEALELAMSDPTLTGFLSWLEAAPPGQNINVA